MNKKTSSAIIAFAIAIGVLLTSCGKPVSWDSEYGKTLKSGIEKYNNGEPMTKQEYNAVKDYKEWEEKNSEQTYDSWNK